MKRHGNLFSQIAAEDNLRLAFVRARRGKSWQILITGFRLNESKFKSNSPRCLTVQFMKGENQHVVFTGSSVLINQLEKYGKEIPFLVTIRKIERYYTLS
jgi:hypothetical protein